MKKQAQQEAEHFEGPVLEYGRMTTALKTALNKRNEKKITYLTAAHDLEAKRAHHSKVVGMGGDRQVRKICFEWARRAVIIWSPAFGLSTRKGEAEVLSSRKRLGVFVASRF